MSGQPIREHIEMVPSVEGIENAVSFKSNEVHVKTNAKHFVANEGYIMSIRD